jgi:hypothetical protein
LHASFDTRRKQGKGPRIFNDGYYIANANKNNLSLKLPERSGLQPKSKILAALIFVYLLILKE